MPFEHRSMRLNSQKDFSPIHPQQEQPQHQQRQRPMEKRRKIPPEYLKEFVSKMRGQGPLNEVAAQMVQTVGRD
jgi:hypothetical protein